jgi:hypothetical protein
MKLAEWQEREVRRDPDYAIEALTYRDECIAALESQLAEARVANESVAVCAHHTEDIIQVDGLVNGCWVCECDRLLERLEAAQ